MDAPLAFRILNLFLFLAVSSLAANASEIVLTAFEPFGGLSVNNSERVAVLLSEKLRATSDSGFLKVKLCVLPVEYDRAAGIAIECIAERRPDLVLALGAGGCSLEFETRARNRDDTYSADNAGVRRRGSKIIPDGPDYVRLNAPMEALFSATPRAKAYSNVLSYDAGAYVCNNTAYWLGLRFGAENSPTRFGFIHVPPTNCGRASNPEVLAEALYRALRTAMPELF